MEREEGGREERCLQVNRSDKADMQKQSACYYCIVKLFSIRGYLLDQFSEYDFDISPISNAWAVLCCEPVTMILY